MERNVRLFYIQETLINGLLFSTPIVILYLTKYISIAQVLMLISIQFFASAVTELPAGASADILGRKLNMGIGAVIYAVSWLIFLFSSSFNQFALCYLFFGIGASFITSPLESIIYESLKNRKERASQIFGKSIFYSTRIAPLSLVLAGFLAKIDYKIVFFLELIKWPIILLTIILMKEHKKALPKPGDFKKHIKGVYSAITYTLNNQNLSTIIFLAAFVYSITYIVTQYDQVLMQKAGVDVALFGIAYAVFISVNGWVARFAYKLEDKINPTLYLRLLLLCYGLVFIAIGIIGHPILLLLLLATKAGTKGLEIPAMKEFTNLFIPSEKRTTILSFQKVIQSIILLFSSAVFTALTGEYEITGSLVIAGFLTITAIPLVVLR